ncbi:glycosyltransferase [Rhodococcoides fascians]|uniref:glycosyltransferase n=1 Tax=Rhodococcoides fascians TaxID=1828 RepID=UPI0024BA79FD|nr:glycosyltransferase [Rhodococcus fascians]MDJ0408173.1 glycosyltransferase [Rhodococcus fascians]
MRAQARTGSDVENTCRVLFVGALRPDKGWKEMARLIAELDPAHCVVAIAGTGRIPQDVNQLLSTRGYRTELHVSEKSLSDLEIASALAKADVVLAPYPLATASGTVMLAVSAGVPVLGFDSPGISDVLTESSTVPVGSFEELGRLVETWRSAPFETHRLAAREYDQMVCRGWLEALRPSALGVGVMK